MHLRLGEPSAQYESGRDIFARLGSEPPREGSLVLGADSLLFFASGADSVSRPLASWAYSQIGDQRLDPAGNAPRLVLRVAHGRHESFAMAEARALRRLADAISARRTGATRPPPLASPSAPVP